MLRKVFYSLLTVLFLESCLSFAETNRNMDPCNTGVLISLIGYIPYPLCNCCVY
jgi:hypothetical protein